MTPAHGSATPQPMSAERWVKLAPLIDTALDLTPGRRPAYYARIAATDAELAADVERCVKACDGEDSLLDRAAEARFALLTADEQANAPGVDLQVMLQQSLGDAYTLERELGGAGMSQVFVATESALGRKVVIKVVAPSRLSGISGERFEREIRLAATLQQANIVPLLSAGSAAGLPFYTMPLVDGRSLLDRLARDGPLPVRDAVSVLRDVARALAYAHARGVVHRDIKPGNVLLSGGTAVVTDFGIATALGVASGGAPIDSVTQSSGGIGTPAYMAPEQATADPTADHRVDLYAFGCLACAVFTGKPPFHGRPPHRIIEAHRHESPPSILVLRPDVPPRIAELIARCLEKDPANRPQSATALLDTLDAETDELRVTTNRRVTTKRVAAGVVAVALLAGSAAFLGEGMFAPRANADGQALSFAVVPFRNVARDSTLEYLADGIGDELLTAIGRLRGVRIMGRTAAYRYKRRPGTEVAAMQRELGARLLVTGSMQQRNGRLIVSAQLNDSVTHDELWAQTYARDANDVGGVSDDIARALTELLRKRFGERVGPRSEVSTGTTNGAALDLYLVGSELLKRRGSGIAESAVYFERAIALDSGFARAYAALAMALEYFPYFTGAPPAEVKGRATAAALKALTLDSTLADAHIALGWVHANEEQWSAADAEFRHAIAIAPDEVAPHFNYGRFLIHVGRTSDALQQFHQARRGERVSSLLSAWISYSLFLTGHTDSALVESALAVQLDSTLLPTTNLGALLNIAVGRRDVARRLMSVIPAVSIMSNAPYVYAKLGDTATAMRLVRTMETSRPRPWFTDVADATVMLAIGDTARALSALERSSRATGLLWIVYIPIDDPAFDSIRSSRRYATLLREGGLGHRVRQRESE